MVIKIIRENAEVPFCGNRGQLSMFVRGGSRILQGRVSNPSEMGRVWGGGGALPRKFLYFLYQNVEFVYIPGDIY